MTPARFSRLRAILDRRQPDLTVLVEDVHKPHNVAAVVRTCDAVGVWEIHAVGAPSFSASRRSAGGVGRYVPVRSHPDLASGLRSLRRRGFRLVAADPAPPAVDFRQIDYRPPIAILLGSELEGLSPGARRYADERIAVPMLGAGASLNVSVAAAVILYEAQRQRAEAGLFEGSRIDAPTRRRVLFEWAYPRLAELYRRRGHPYPTLGPGGELPDGAPRG